MTSPTDWVSQLVTVHKSDGTVRLCIDPRPLNEAVYIRRDRYHLPTFTELLPEMSDAQVFSKVDLRAGYWHVQLDEESSMLTTLQTPYGKFRWKRLPFGLKVSSEIFQRKVHEALDGLDGIYCIADDIVIAGVGEDLQAANKSHDERLQALFERCQCKGIVLNKKKFVLRVPRMVFMGHVLGTDGIRPDPTKVKAILDMPNPTDVAGARRLLEVINFLAQFLPALSEVVKPIQDLTHNDVAWSWGTEQQKAMQTVKALLCANPVLAHFDARK